MFKFGGFEFGSGEKHEEEVVLTPEILKNDIRLLETSDVLQVVITKVEGLEPCDEFTEADIEILKQDINTKHKVLLDQYISGEEIDANFDVDSADGLQQLKSLVFMNPNMSEEDAVAYEQIWRDDFEPKIFDGIKEQLLLKNGDYDSLLEAKSQIDSYECSDISVKEEWLDWLDDESMKSFYTYAGLSKTEPVYLNGYTSWFNDFPFNNASKREKLVIWFDNLVEESFDNLVHESVDVGDLDSAQQLIEEFSFSDELKRAALLSKLEEKKSTIS